MCLKEFDAEKNISILLEVHIHFNTLLFQLKRVVITLQGYLISTIITKTCLNNFDSLKPHFYTVKLGFTGVYNGGSNEYPQSVF